MSKMQVSLPVNMMNKHWYVAVVNAKKRAVQVLDSVPSAIKQFKKGHPKLENMVHFSMLSKYIPRVNFHIICLMLLKLL